MRRVDAVTTDEAPSCELQVTWRALGAGDFEFGSDMILLNVESGIDPLVSVDVDPALTVTVDQTYVVDGDDVTITYTVDGGNAHGTNEWSWEQILPAGFDVASYVSDSCGVSTRPSSEDSDPIAAGENGVVVSMGGTAADRCT